MARITYKIDGKRIPSVTTVLGLLNKPLLVKWANNLGLEGINVTKYVNNLAQIGTLAHYFVECDCKNKDPVLNDYSLEQIDTAKVSLKKWYEWTTTVNFEPLENELALTHNQLKYGGTIDILANVNGKKTLIDIKTSKSLYLEHFIQLSAYEELLMANGYNIDKVMIVRIGRNPDEGFQVKELSIDQRTTLMQIFGNLLSVYNFKKTDDIKKLTTIKKTKIEKN